GHAGRCQLLAVGAESPPADWPGVTTPDEERLQVLVLCRVGRQVPDHHPLVLARGSQESAVRAEGHTPDALLVPAEGPHRLPRGQVPDLHVLGVSRDCQITTVGTERQVESATWPPPLASPNGDRLGLAPALEVVPFPAAQVGRTLLEQFLGPARVVARQFPLRQDDTLEVQSPEQVFLGSLLAPQGLLGLLLFFLDLRVA